MLDDLRAELALLRRRLEAQRAAESHDEEFVEEPLPGEPVETPLGAHWVALTHWASAKRHGSFDLAELPDDGAVYLDTETTGLAGGAGTLPFLVGIGRRTARGFEVKQYFARDFDEEPSVLAALAEDLRQASRLVTYNGKAYDVPLLESRYTLARLRTPFASLDHLDLLYDARRRWKLRYESCRLVELENQVLGIERQGDVAGHLIPHLYFEFLRTKRAHRLVPVFRHNAFDILSLACLAVVVPGAELTHAAEMIGVGRWLQRQGQTPEAIELFERAYARPEFGRLPKRRQYDVLVELTKHFERTLKDASRALEFAVEARLASDSAEARRREERLRKKASAPLLQSRSRVAE